MRIPKIIIILLAILLSGVFVSCAGITETGNPQKPTEAFYEPDGQPEAQPAAEDIATYQNDEYGVIIDYVDDWTYEESGDQSYVEFTSPEDSFGNATKVLISFEILETQPTSLFAFLLTEYPGREFLYYITPYQSGYVYDDPNIGPNGGDLKEYFFLNDDLLVHVEAEIFTSTEGEFKFLLNSIRYF